MSKRHNCQWRTAATGLEARLTSVVSLLEDATAKIAVLTTRVNELEHEGALAKKQLIGPKSERMPTPDDELRKKSAEQKPRGGHVNPKKRKENREAMARLPTTIVQHPVPEAERKCAHCGEEIRAIGEGDKSIEYEWVPGHIERRLHVVETGRCPCKQHYARGPAPVRVVEGCTYGPAFLAKLAIDKCGDATPIYRVEKQMRRSGIPISRSTLNDLVLLAGEVCMPLRDCAVSLVRTDPNVQADETSFRVQGVRERAFVWTFLSKDITAYIFSPDRSGETPAKILGGTSGSLTVDGYTGYNIVSDVNGRERTGCWSHARRYLFDALASAPEARGGLDIILELFMIEREVVDANAAGTPQHLAIRNERSAEVLRRLENWRDSLAPRFEPKSAMGRALAYMKNQWDRLGAFLRDPKIPIHNNASEAALRIIALARKNSLFFGTHEAGEKFMALYSLLAMCDQHDVNPEVYLTDVLIRIQDHPKSALGELLPHRWKLTHGSGFTVDRVLTSPATI